VGGQLFEHISDNEWTNTKGQSQNDNLEKLTTYGTHTEVETQNVQSIETGKCRSHKTKNKKQAKTKQPTKCALDTTIRKQILSSYQY
jgi:hypothetical protein